MLFAKLKMVVSMELPVPLGSISKEDAEKEFLKDGGDEELHRQVLQEIRSQIGDTGTAELIECSTTLVEV